MASIKDVADKVRQQFLSEKEIAEVEATALQQYEEQRIRLEEAEIISDRPSVTLDVRVSAVHNTREFTGVDEGGKPWSKRQVNLTLVNMSTGAYFTKWVSLRRGASVPTTGTEAQVEFDGKWLTLN